MKWREVISIVLRKCKWKIILTLILLAVFLLTSNLALAKPDKFTVSPLDGSSGGSSDPGDYPDPNIDPL
ncbi:MAG: hypothetical protein DRK00_06440 [Thermoprotei archaeon]|nr:MAG: hypothetical protein DRK00_06440 [Thermoprotei archaeon]